MLMPVHARRLLHSGRRPPRSPSTSAAPFAAATPQPQNRATSRGLTPITFSVTSCMAARPSLQTTTPDACTSSLAPAGAHADDLPPELLLIIFGFLDPVTLNRVAGVSRSWRQWARDPVLWKTLSARHFPATRGSRPSTDWYKLYRGMFLAQVPRKRAAILRATDSTVDVPPLPQARPRSFFRACRLRLTSTRFGASLLRTALCYRPSSGGGGRGAGQIACGPTHGLRVLPPARPPASTRGQRSLSGSIVLSTPLLLPRI